MRDKGRGGGGQKSKRVRESDKRIRETKAR